MNARSLKTAGATAAALLGLAATSYGYLGATGSGSGSGSVDASRTVTIAAGLDAGHTLLPTGEAHGRLRLSLSNDTGSPIKVSELVLDTSRGAGGYSPEADTCDVTYAATQAIRTNNGAGWTLGSGTTNITLENAVSMATTAPSSCQGDTVDIYLKTS